MIHLIGATKMFYRQDGVKEYFEEWKKDSSLSNVRTEPDKETEETQDTETKEDASETDNEN